MSKLSLATKNEMLDLSVEIIAEEKHQREQKRHGLSTSERICDLYDRSDSVFCAERVKSLLDELAECRRQRESSPVGEIVAWSGTDREKGITREVDFRFLRFDVMPGTKLYALKPAPAILTDVLAAIRGGGSQTELIEALTAIKPKFGAPGSRDVDVRAANLAIDKAIEKLSNL